MKRWLLVFLVLIPIISASSSNFYMLLNLEDNKVALSENLNINLYLRNKNTNLATPLVIEFLIKNFNNDTIIKDTRTIILDKEKNVYKDIYISPSTRPGNYVLVTNIFYGNETYSDYKTFSVYEKNLSKIARYTNTIIFLIILLVTVLILVLVNMQRNSLKNIDKNLDKRLKDIYNNYVKYRKSDETLDKLERLKSLLRDAYDKKYVTKKTYKLDNKNINKLITKIKRNRKI